jgi:hypothetical protein
MVAVGLVVHRSHGEPPKCPDRLAVRGDRRRRKHRAGRRLRERQELVGEARHGAADANAADVRAPAYAGHPAALADIALHHWTPAAELHDATRCAWLRGEFRLLIITAPVATLVHGLAEQPGGAEFLIQRDCRGSARRMVEEIEQHFHEVVRLHRAARHADNRQPRGGAPAPSEVVRQTHAAGRVPGHGVDAAVRSAGPGRDDSPGLRGQAVDPLARRDRLPRRPVDAHGRPESLLLVLFVGDRAFHHEEEGGKKALCGAIPGIEELVAVLIGQYRMMQPDLGQTRDATKHQIFEARLGRCRDRDRITVTAEAGRDPEDVHHLDNGGAGILLALVGGRDGHSCSSIKR